MMNNDISLKEAIEAYKQSLIDAGKSPRTLYTYGKDFEQIQRFFGEDKNLASVHKAQVGKFMRSDELLLLPNWQPRTEKTVTKTYSVLKMFLHWAQQKGLIEEVPLPKGKFIFKSESEG